MIVKAVEIRDAATFIPALAIKMEPHWPGNRYLLRRLGYAFDPPSVLVINLATGRAEYDQHAWGGRTMPVAHAWITENFDDMRDDGEQVVDVEFILGETTEPKRSESYEAPL